MNPLKELLKRIWPDRGRLVLVVCCGTNKQCVAPSGASEQDEFARNLTSVF